jgi:hypothetical protein
MCRRMLKIVAICLFLVGAISVTLVSAKVDMVEINHNGNVISVPASAVPAHLDHGDTLVDDGDGCDPILGCPA